MGKPLIIAAAVAALLLGAYKLTLAQPEPVAAKPKPKVHGTVYVLSQDILVDLAGGGYATITLGLEVESGTDVAEAQTGLVREVVTNDLTGIDRDDLRVRARRDALKLKLARDIRKHTDVELDGVLLTDFSIS